MTQRAVVKGVGHYLPERIVPNSEFEKTLDTTDEWIKSRSGIERRHFAAEGETTEAEPGSEEAITEEADAEEEQANLSLAAMEQAVLPGVIPRMAIAGGAMAVVVLGVSVLPWAWARALAGPLILVLWVVLPPAIFYSRALRRRATLRRYMRGECPACRTPGSITTGRCSMRCMPKTPDCGGLRMGVESMEPKTPPLVMEKVPPLRSSKLSLLSRALRPRSPMPDSISAKLSLSAARSTGTTKPRGELTATPMS